MAVVVSHDNVDGRNWAHEYGHTQGLHDTYDPAEFGFLMYLPLSFNNRKVTQAQCDFLRYPIN